MFSKLLVALMPSIEASHVHLQVRAYMRTVAKPGIAMFELVETLEEKVRTLIEVRLLDAAHCGTGSSMQKLTAGVARGILANLPAGHLELGSATRCCWEMTVSNGAHWLNVAAKPHTARLCIRPSLLIESRRLCLDIRTCHCSSAQD